MCSYYIIYHVLGSELCQRCILVCSVRMYSTDNANVALVCSKMNERIIDKVMQDKSWQWPTWCNCALWCCACVLKISINFSKLYV